MTDRRNLSESNDFIFVTPQIVEKKRVKKYGVGGETIPYKPEKEEEEWVSKEIKEQISSTISRIQEKELKDIGHVYIVLGLSTTLFIRKRRFPTERVRVFDPNVQAVLSSLSAEVLAYLNEEHNKLLVSCPLSNLVKILKKETYFAKYFQYVKRISPLIFEEQVSEYLRVDTDWLLKPKPLLVYLVPNIAEDRRRDYLKDLLDYLEKMQVEIVDYDDAGFVLVILDEKSTRGLLQASNFIFKVGGVPQGILERVRHNKLKKKMLSRKNQLIEGEVSSINSKEPKQKTLTKICVMDSGVNDIPMLSNLIVLKDGLTGFYDLNDGCSHEGHGTPIACLAAYGEELIEPKARIISYKLYADNRRNEVYQGFRRAITKYAREARIFLSAINFEREHAEATAFLDRLIQEMNACVVFSAGNISKQTILNCIASGTPYPSYIRNFPVQHPSEAITIVAVGAISKKDSNATIARKDELSPFSRCGTRNPLLYQCPKPEVVQHGGNICRDGSTIGVGLESFDKNGNKVEGFAGTSFSAPLFAARLAEIEAKYGSKINNAETFKAIALASSHRKVLDCMGFGETRYFCTCGPFHALIISEGTIPLPDTTRPEYSLFYEARILVRVPKRIEEIEMFIVHSDNHTRVPMPSLNTFLRVYAEKTGREKGWVSLDNPEEFEKKSHMKVFKWAFKRKSMEGDWTFVIRPDTTADMLPEHRRETIVRFGCAILLTAKTTPLFGSLSEEVRRLMEQRSYCR